MILYASRTGTRRNLSAMRAHKWRLLISATGVWRTEGFAYAIDNGAWTAWQLFQAGKRLTADPDLGLFKGVVAKLGAGADWIVVPDVVQGGARSWALTRYWLRKLRRDRRLKGVRLLIAVQDGFDPWTVARYLGPRVGLFVGGSTEWKLRTMAEWARLARTRGAYCHIARVNTGRRIHLCNAVQADSCDGTSGTMFAKNIPRLTAANQQLDFAGAWAA